MSNDSYWVEYKKVANFKLVLIPTNFITGIVDKHRFDLAISVPVYKDACDNLKELLTADALKEFRKRCTNNFSKQRSQSSQLPLKKTTIARFNKIKESGKFDSNDSLIEYLFDPDNSLIETLHKLKFDDELPGTELGILTEPFIKSLNAEHHRLLVNLLASVYVDGLAAGKKVKGRLTEERITKELDEYNTLQYIAHIDIQTNKRFWKK